MSDRTCTADGCTRSPRTPGSSLCSAHYHREYRRRDRTQRCTIDGCDQVHVARGWCAAHYQRWQAHGDPLTVADQTAEANPHWRGDDISYGQAHTRVRNARGPAPTHACAHGCGRAAQHWAYDHTDPDEKRDPDGLPYSVDVDRYLPLCVSCHKVFDLAS